MRLLFSVPAHVDNEEQYVQAMEKFGDNLVCREDPEVGSAFLRFAVFTRELTALFKNLVRAQFKLVLMVLFWSQSSLSSRELPVCRCRT